MGKQYAWEADVEWLFLDDMDEINAKAPDNFSYEVIGIAVMNIDSGEAAMFTNFPINGDTLELDVLSDIAGDAEMLYEKSLNARRKGYKNK